jgi:hypothetical protein
LKYKFVESASFIVIARNEKRSVTLGLYDGGKRMAMHRYSGCSRERRMCETRGGSQRESKPLVTSIGNFNGKKVGDGSYAGPEGQKVKAPAVYKSGEKIFWMKAKVKWIEYSVADLSEADRELLIRAADSAGR